MRAATTTHSDRRHCTTTLFAFPIAATRELSGSACSKNVHQEFFTSIEQLVRRVARAITFCMILDNDTTFTRQTGAVASG